MRGSGASASVLSGRAAVIAWATLVAILAVVLAWSYADRSETRSSELAVSSRTGAPEPSPVASASSGTQTVIGTLAAEPPAEADKTAGRSLIEKDVWTLSASRIVEKGTSMKVSGGRMTYGRVLQARAESKGVKSEHVFTARISVFEPTAPSSLRPYSIQGSWRIDPKRTASSVRYTATGVKGTLSGRFEEPPLEMDTVRLGVLVMGRRALGSRASGKGVYQGSGDFEGTLTIPRVPMPEGD